MCNRYSASKLRGIRALGARFAPGHHFTRQWHPIYNIQPKCDVPVVVKTAEHPLKVMRWGTWTVDGLLANVSFEEITTKPTWKNAAQHRRCLILADGFYAWENVGQKKFGHYFSVPNRDAFCIAGLWLPANEDQPERCIIVNTEANSLVAPFNRRMPCILVDENAALWLGDEPIAPEVIARLCQPYPEQKMSHWHSPPEVIRTDFQDPVAIQPWQSRPAASA